MLRAGMIILDINEWQSCSTKPLGLIGFHKKAPVITIHLGSDQDDIRDRRWFKQHDGNPPKGVYPIVISI
jgi:hypothetical protein